MTPGTDSYWAAAPELTRTPKPPEQDHGLGTIMAIEGLVELGMTPSQAIVAATRNGAIAARGLNDFGTLEAGKLADLVVLTADPLADIANLRKVATVWKDGRSVDRDRLPETRVLSVAPPGQNRDGTGARPAMRELKGSGGVPLGVIEQIAGRFGISIARAQGAAAAWAAAREPHARRAQRAGRRSARCGR